MLVLAPAVERPFEVLAPARLRFLLSLTRTLEALDRRLALELVSVEAACTTRCVNSHLVDLINLIDLTAFYRA